jgi:hypothetical protein
MFIKKDANLIVDLINAYLPKELAEDPDIIIAGGFALNAFLASEALTGVSEEIASVIKNNIIINPLMKFSDIDLWLTEGSTSKFAPLFQHVPNGSNPSKRSKHPLEGGLEISGQKLSCEMWSDWANTYHSPNKGRKLVPIQCIVKPQSLAEDLISGFDLGICSVGIYRGEFIIHESLFDSLKEKEIRYNNRNSFGNKSLGSRVFQSLRFFKYRAKTSFQFSKDLYDDVMTTMSDANNFWIEARKSGAISQYGTVATPGAKVKITTTKDYEQEIIAKESLVGMINRLAQLFFEMQKMSHWNVTHALFFQDSEIFSVKGIIEKNLVDSEKAKATAKALDDLFNDLI